MRYMSARENMQQLISMNAALSPIKDAAKGLSVPLDLEAALSYMDQAAIMFTSRLSTRYPSLQQDHIEAIRKLITDKFTPQAFCDHMEELRDFFEVDARYIAFAALTQLAADGAIGSEVVAQAMSDLAIDPEKPNPVSC